MNDIIDNGALDIKQRLDLIKDFLLNSNIAVLSVSKKDEYFYAFDIEVNGAKKIINIYPKNIVNSGWSEKPYIKRIQVPSFLGKTIPLNNKEQCSLFLGIAFVNNKPIFAVWNPFTYVFHKTNRSCYVNVESLDICYHNGLYKTIDSKKEIILCDKDNFGQLLEIYFEENC